MYMAAHMSKSTAFLLSPCKAALLTFLVDQQQDHRAVFQLWKEQVNALGKGSQRDNQEPLALIFI